MVLVCTQRARAFGTMKRTEVVQCVGKIRPCIVSFLFLALRSNTLTDQMTYMIEWGSKIREEMLKIYDNNCFSSLKRY